MTWTIVFDSFVVFVLSALVAIAIFYEGYVAGKRDGMEFTETVNKR